MGAATVYALVALLASLCYVSTAPSTVASDVDIDSKLPVLTPDGKVYVYTYSASVASGQNEPVSFVSKFQIYGKLLYKSQRGSTYLKFQDIEYAIYNGRDDGELHGKYQPLEEDIKDFQEPFLVVYDEHNKIEGIKVKESEAMWSKNMKKAVATIFQLERIDNRTAGAYQRYENTLHGKCKMDHMVYSKPSDVDKVFYLRKAYEPRNCTDYVSFVQTDSKDDDCNVPAEEDLVTTAEKVYAYGSVKDVADYVLKKVSSHEKFSYLPWSHRNYGVQFIETNQTFAFEKAAEESELHISVQNLADAKISRLDFEIDSQEGIKFARNEIKSDDLIAKVKEMLIEMVDFLKENQIDIEEEHPEHKYLVVKLYRFLGYMDKQSLRYVFDHFNLNSEKGRMTRKIFLRMIPHVGTRAVWELVKDIITDTDIEMDDDTKIDILTNLPMYVLHPSKNFTEAMADYLSFGDAVSYKVQRAAILCYSILLHKTFKNIRNDPLVEGFGIPKELEHYLSFFYQRIKHENTYNNKILYMMAMRNVEVGNIYQYLAPIINGEDIFYVDVTIEKPEKYRIAAMWAVAKSISHDYDQTYNLFWPILANSSMPLSMRITAYEHLVPRNPLLDMRILMRVHALMETESDEHLFNYHYTTLKSNAESTSPCMKLHAENMRKVLHLTKPRKIISAALSTANVHDYYDDMYGHGKTFKMAAEMNEASGVPQTGYYEIVSTYLRKQKLTTGYYWNIDGINLDTILKIMKNLINPEMQMSQITDEKVLKILQQTQGHKLFDRHIHFELWTMDKGYVTNVQVFFENGLSDLLRQCVDQYKPKADQLMDVKEKFNINALDISFFNQYKMIVATDMGLPAIFYNDVPYMSYTKLKPDIYPQKNTIAMKVEFETRFHRHSVYEMMFYNPFADITHAVQRHIVAAGSLPIDVTFSFQMPSQSIKLELPRLAKQSSAAGFKIHSFDQVVIGEDLLKNNLKAHCPTCQDRTHITNGPTHKNTHLQVYHQLDSGLEFTYGMFDCEHDFEPRAEMQEWFRIFDSPTNNRKDDVFAKFWMIMDQGLFNFANNPYTGTCGVIMKVAPCTTHPASHVEMNWRINMAHKSMPIRGNIDVKSAKSNETMRSWDVELGTDLSRYVSSFTAKLTRKVPGEKNLKVCLEGQKVYPDLATDISMMEYKTHGKLSFTMGRNDGDECASEEVNIKAKFTGERLEEQIEQMKNYVKPGSCFKNASNPLDLDIMQPFDWNCLYQTVKSTTMRSYIVDLSYETMPHESLAKLQMIEDWIRSSSWPQITYRPEHTDKGNVKIYVTYPDKKNYGNITVVNPYYTWELIDVIYEEDDIEKRQNDLVFDNTVFPTAFLVDFYKEDIRPCIAHAHDLINDLNQTIPMEFKDWTLMYGDHGLMSYAVFVKTVPHDKVSVRIYSPQHLLEVIPGDSKHVVTLDGNIITYDDEELSVPSDGAYYKIRTINKMLVIETEKYSKVRVYYTPYNVIVLPHIILDRSIDGICGHMGSTIYTQQSPLVYSSA